MRKVIVFFLLLTACRPDPEPAEECQIEGWGTIRIQNFSSDQYEVSISSLITVSIDGNASTTIQKVAAGQYRADFRNLRTGGGGFIDDVQVNACDISLIPIIF